MIHYTMTLREKLEKQLAEIAEHCDDGYERATACEAAVNNALLDLKQFIKAYTFRDGEEIHFFKTIKPAIQSKLIFWKEFKELEIRRPRACTKEQLALFYFTEGERVSGYLLYDQVLYQYFKAKRSEEDLRLFTRESQHPDTSIDYDVEFTTHACCVFARIMGYEAVLDYLEERIGLLDRKAPASGQPDLNWTDSKASLIELAYALHAHGAVNKGRCDVKEIIGALETAFNTETGNFYRTFQSMRLRKKSRTAYLEGLAESLTKRMDDTDAAF